MKLASAFSLAAAPRDAAAALAEDLLAKLGGPPQLVVLYATQHLAHDDLLAGLRERLAGVQIVGGTSCGGVMTDAGFHCGPDGAVGALGVLDPQGAYGVGACGLEGGARQAGAEAISRALAAADREFETPALVWCCQPPGEEEAVIEGVQSVIGARTPIIGGSSADETIAGDWSEFATEAVLHGHAVVAALFPSAQYGAAFQSGYAPSGVTGVITRANDRQIIEIDHRPAAEVYSAWTDGRINAAASGPILAKSTPAPLGRVAADVQGVPMFVLSHPAMVGTGGDLSLFTDIREGDLVHLMHGSPDSLVKRAGLVVDDACAMGGWRREDTLGGLVIYCGGCMLHVRERMDEVAALVREAMPKAPFLGAFTFGEQGAIVDSCNRHGNLMVSALTFG
ncbi:FIST signal transduction protein [Phenylobacterium sp.]|uniref:FIST signal transduction protein n=1 Tax=Phenylobacterium sp. TaxID=1871053 RepID=UPI0035AED122